MPIKSPSIEPPISPINIAQKTTEGTTKTAVNLPVEKVKSPEYCNMKIIKMMAPANMYRRYAPSDVRFIILLP